ncbi:MAG: hypothetical protein AAGA48_14980 [Myxococcota bacterium]
MTRAPFIVSALALVACGGSDLPRDGAWVSEAAVVDTNSCVITPEEAGIPTLTGFNLERDLDGSFTLVPMDGSDDPVEYDCDLLLGEMTCDIERFDIPLGPTSLRFRLTLVGDFETRRATLRQVAEGDCEGTGCVVAKNKLETEFPCTIDVSYESKWDSDDLGPLGEE